MSVFSGVYFNLVVNYLKSKVWNLRYDFLESSCAVMIDTTSPCEHFIDDFIDASYYWLFDCMFLSCHVRVRE